ncbi:MAG: NAD(P)H-hydrate dehydratase, partial [Hadesarchaea archaeon]
KGRAQQVRVASKELGCTVLLKAWVDVIASPAGKVKLNYTGNSGMTVGGTGDVLAGVVGAFLSQGVEPFKAAVAGAWACGHAGDLCYKERGYELLASDLIEKLPAVFKEVMERK